MPDRAVLGLPLAPDPALFDELAGEVWASDRYTNGGPLAARLESHLRTLLDVPCAVLVSSGTAALSLALLALDLAPGSEVITSPLTFVATANAISAAGLVPVFADVRADDGCVDPDMVEAAITSRTAAVLAVHVFGMACDTDRLAQVGERHGIPILYDAAHAFGVRYGQGHAQGIGRAGAMSAFSLHATKLLHTGEGGVLTSPDGAAYEQLSARRNFGLDGIRAQHLGLNFKLPELSAALGLAVLPRVADERAARRRLACAYDAMLAECRFARPLVGSVAATRGELFYPVRVDRPDRRDRLCAALQTAGVDARRFESLTDHGIYRSARLVHGGQTPVASQLADTVLCLPFHGRVTGADIERATRAFRSLDRT